jgi:GT2 family glycosyltransferase
VIRNQDNLGFIESCNRAAQSASNDVLVFLNNDTIALPDWLSPLLKLLRDSRVGAVGGKLLQTDGSLQEAGGVIFSDASGANFGRGSMKPNSPLFSHVRDVDYCSGALLATPRQVFLEVGGFDSRYRPAYYEDADYCFGLRKLGLRVLFQPESAVVHLDGASSKGHCGGAKRYQELNRRKFVDKWRRELLEQPVPPGRFDDDVWYSLAGATRTSS